MRQARNPAPLRPKPFLALPRKKGARRGQFPCTRGCISAPLYLKRRGPCGRTGIHEYQPRGDCFVFWEFVVAWTDLRFRKLIRVPRRWRHYMGRGDLPGHVVGHRPDRLAGHHRLVAPADARRHGSFWAVAVPGSDDVQLVLFLFFSALLDGDAVAQEKDRRTFLLLLMTDLRDREIVLGKLMGSLLPIGLMLLGSVPILMFLVLLGGVSVHQVLQAVVVTAATALAAGSLGGLVGLARPDVSVIGSDGAVPGLVSLPGAWPGCAAALLSRSPSAGVLSCRSFWTPSWPCRTVQDPMELLTRPHSSGLYLRGSHGGHSAWC